MKTLMIIMKSIPRRGEIGALWTIPLQLGVTSVLYPRQGVRPIARISSIVSRTIVVMSVGEGVSMRTRDRPREISRRCSVKGRRWSPWLWIPMRRRASLSSGWAMRVRRSSLSSTLSTRVVSLLVEVQPILCFLLVNPQASKRQRTVVFDVGTVAFLMEKGITCKAMLLKFLIFKFKWNFLPGNLKSFFMVRGLSPLISTWMWLPLASRSLNFPNFLLIAFSVSGFQ